MIYKKLNNESQSENRSLIAAIKKILQFPTSLTEGIEKHLSESLGRLGEKQEAQRRRRLFRLLLLTELLAIAVVLYFSTDRFEVLQSVFYSTGPGSVTELVLAPLAYGIDKLKTAFLQGHYWLALKEVYLGTRMHWMTVGFQTVLLFCLMDQIKKIERNRAFLFLHTVALTFLLGLLLDLVLRGLALADTALTGLLSESNPATYVYIVAKALLMLLLFLIALSSFLENYKLYLKLMMPAMGISMGLMLLIFVPPMLLAKSHKMPWLFDEETDFFVRMLSYAEEHTVEFGVILVMIGIMLAYWIIVSRKKKPTQTGD